MKIKSFIYLDDYKMYSFSSQLFEGITQYILKEDVQAGEEQNSQKGSFLSGRFMADMMFQKNAQTEMRYLHDFAFNLFEKELEGRKLIFDVQANTAISDLQGKNFIRVKGKIIFEDYAKIQYTIDHFNEIGRAFAELNNNEILQILDNFKTDMANTKDREKKFKQNQSLKQTEKQVEQALIASGLNVDPNLAKNLSKIINFGYRDNYEVRLVKENSETLYTAIINQAYLKESEQNLISKYARKSEKEFTIIGIVSQTGLPKAKIPFVEGNSMKDATLGFLDKIADMEEQFNGRSEKECIIDPIAIFTEI